MKEIKNGIEKGSTVRLTENHETFNRTYTKGHLFEVYGDDIRGWTLQDSDGNTIEATLLVGKLDQVS